MLEASELKDLVIETAGDLFRDRAFRQDELIYAVEERLRSRARGAFAGDGIGPGGDTPGRAAIESAISELRREDRLRSPGAGLWRVPARYWPALASRGGSNGSSANGAPADEATIRERLRRLEDVTGRLGGPPVPDAALDRDALYD